jgi:predicted ATPase
VTDLLRHVLALSCLVTSRRVLNVKAEYEFRVLPLAVPVGNEDAARMMEIPSVAMFVDRCRSFRPDFHLTDENARSIADLARRLEGVPLAIELAASRARLLPPATMLSQLTSRLDFLVSHARDAGERHRTMRAALACSCEGLPASLETFFARLSVFRGGWTSEAAAAVCEEPRALDRLQELQERSLVYETEVPGAPGLLRFAMLESIREYGADQLPDEDRQTAEERHARYYRALAEQTVDGAGDGTPADRLQLDVENLRAAQAWFRGRGQEDAVTTLEALLTDLEGDAALG